MGQLRTFRRKVLRAQHGAKQLKSVTSLPQKFRAFRPLEDLIWKANAPRVRGG